MGIQLKPRSKLLLYAQSAQIIRDFLISKDSFRNLVYAHGIEEKKQVFALVIQTLKYRNVLIYLLSLAQIPGFLYHELVQYERLLGLMAQELANLTEGDGNDVTNQKSKNTTPTQSSEATFTTRNDQHTVYYESLLFQTKKSRLLWSQDQSKKENEKRRLDNPDNNQIVDDISDNDDQNDNGNNKSTSSSNGNEDEGDTTGISNSWFSAFITYNHKNTTKPSQNKTKSKNNTNNTSNNPATNTNDEQNIFRYPIECLLVLGYDLLFGSKELPKLSDLKMDKKQPQTNDNLTPKQAKIAQRQAASDARLKTFQQGILDGIKMFNIPNPPKVLNSEQLKSRAKLIKKGKTYDEVDSLCAVTDNDVMSGKKNKKDKGGKKTITDIPTTITFPILPSHYLSTVPILPETGEYTITPGITFKQRLQIAIKYLTSLLPVKPNSTPQQIQQQTHPDFFIPHELRGHYKRSIPRYVRINTNKTTHTNIIDKLIKEHGYTQLDVIPRMYQFPRPNMLNEDTNDENNNNNNNNDAICDQFDTKLPGYLDQDHIIAQITPNLRRNTATWDKYFNIIDSYLKVRLPKLYHKLSSQLTTYKQTTAIQRQQMASQTTGKSSNNVFWVDNVLPDVLCFPPRDDAIVHSDLVKEGYLVIQDRSSCLPPAILHPPMNSICIDACSAPGNKTSYLSAILKNTGKVYAIELNQTRAKLMQNRMELTNCKNVEVVQTSFFDILPTNPKYNKVEYIMLDPSCSGSGNIHTPQFLDSLLSTSTMISPFSKKQHLSHLNDNNNNTNAATTPNDTNNQTTNTNSNSDNKITFISPPKEQLNHVESLSRLQIRLIKHAMSFPNLKAFIYSTCSIYHVENENVVLNIAPIAREHGFELVSALPLFPGRGVNHPIFESDDNDDVKNDGKKKQKKKQDGEKKNGKNVGGDDDDINQPLKKQRNISSNDQDESSSNDNVVLGTDLNKTVRVDHSLYHAGGFYVALFARPDVYNNDLLDKLLEETKTRYSAHFQ